LLPPSFEINETETIVLECETSHTVSTSWAHDGKELSGMDHRELIQEGRIQRLLIKRASPKDQGVYTCSVKDHVTSTRLTVHGTVFLIIIVITVKLHLLSKQLQVQN
jgi:hypothetical protein